MNAPDPHVTDHLQRRAPWWAALERLLKNSVAARLFPVSSLVLPLDTPPIDVDVQTDEASLARLLAHVEQTWTRLGDEEPHWSVLSAEEFKAANLPEHEAAFYASGRNDLRLLLAFLERNDIDAGRLSNVLEYGCGVGRTTRFLASRFAQVQAWDISSSHLRLAEAYLAREQVRNVTLHRVRTLADVDGPPDVDLLFSFLVLQHNPPPVIAALLQRLLARLRPGGIAYVQLPTHACDYRFKLDDYLAHGLSATHIEMHCLPQRHVFRIAKQAGCQVLEVREDTWCGRPRSEISNTFLMQRG